jgi:DNA invertase Pin-like site-specific DNA recombinase
MRAALYLRVSTEEQTTANQRQVLEELAQRRGSAARSASSTRRQAAPVIARCGAAS